MFVKINGERHYLWRAVNNEGEVLESFVTKTRDKKAASKFIKKEMRKHGRPDVIFTDQLRSYGAALKEFGNAARGAHSTRRITLALADLPSSWHHRPCARSNRLLKNPA